MKPSRGQVLQLSTVVWLAAVWVALWGDVTLANILAGVIVALVITWLLPLPRVPVGGRLHPLSLIALLAMILYLSIEASVQVAWLAVRPEAPPLTGVLRVKLAIKSDLVLVLCSDTLNMIPGTMVLEMDRVNRSVYVHVLDVGSEAAVDKFYRDTRLLERMFIRAFERESEWRETEFITEVG